MTPAIPLGGERKRPSKSCMPCRQAKAKCTGLSEEYLHRVDNEPDFTPDPDVKCTRCLRQSNDCTFAPSRRKGRPRRVARGRPSPAEADSPHSSGSPSGSPIRSGSDFNPNRTTADSTGRPPSQATSLSGSVHSPCWSSPHPTPESALAPLPPQSVETIAEAYLNEIYLWCPILPSDSAQLQHYLATSDPALTLALASIIEPTRPPPVFPPTTGFISISTLQTAVLLSLRAYGVKDRSRAVELIEWVSNEFRALGWKGNNTSTVSSEVRNEDLETFVGLGFLVWGLTIQLGVLTGNRNLLLADVQPPTEMVPQTMILHAFSLLRDATDFESLWARPEDQRFLYTVDIVQRSDRIQRAAIEFLRSTTPAFDPSSPQTPATLAVAAAREAAFLASSIAPSAIILLLSSTSPLSPLIAPSLPCSLDTTSYPTGPLASLVRVAANKILEVVRTAPTREGMSVACQPHSPYWGCCFLVTARGLLLGAEASQVESQQNGGGGGGASASTSQGGMYDKMKMEEDLDLCEAILKQQAVKWPAAESLMTEVGLLRRTAGIA